LSFPLFSSKNIAQFDSLSVTSPSIDSNHFKKHPLPKKHNEIAPHLLY
jgi:hypothetical protein